MLEYKILWTSKCVSCGRSIPVRFDSNGMAKAVTRIVIGTFGNGLRDCYVHKKCIDDIHESKFTIDERGNVMFDNLSYNIHLVNEEQSHDLITARNAGCDLLRRC
jgi:hypothetical protein